MPAPMNNSVRTMVADKAAQILHELQANGKLHAIKEINPQLYIVDQALILDPKEFSKEEIVKLFQLSIALNKGLVKLA